MTSGGPRFVCYRADHGQRQVTPRRNWFQLSSTRCLERLTDDRAPTSRAARVCMRAQLTKPKLGLLVRG